MQPKNQNNKGFYRRLWAFGIVITLVFSVFIMRLYQLQIVSGEYYASQAQQTVTYTFTTAAARGEIVDRNGNLLATNTTTHSLVLNRLFLQDSNLNPTLLALCELLQQSGEAWVDPTPISDSLPYEFTAHNEDGSESLAVANMKEAFGLKNSATAEQVVAAAVAMYGLEEYTVAQQRTLLGIRYEMQRVGYSGAAPYTFAEDVGDKTVAVVSENAAQYTGVEIYETYKRVYPQGTAIPHVLGVTGLISENEWLANNYALRESGYAIDDTIGKFGLERAFETQLRGQEGIVSIVRSSNGELLSTEVLQEAKAGNTVQLTIDLEYQLLLGEMLEEYVGLLQTRTGTENAEGGALVVLKPSTGEVLGYANYPSYDINDYYTMYTELANAELNPMYNRAFQQLYRPGSTFKPVVALTGLNTGVITPTSTVLCTGVYTYYADYQPGCLGVHGNTNVVSALQYSCNIFFYDVGRRVGEAEYNAMAQAMGLGVATGLEVGESVGMLTSPETSDLLGSSWVPANVVQGAIGQMDTLVTPVQLATYAATLANNGTRYRTHLVGALLEHQTGQAITTYGSEVVSQVEDAQAFETVRQGMVMASQGSNYSEYLGDWNGRTIASKTGSPQVTTDQTNGVIIAYGPAEDADIAVAIVMENGTNGYRLAELMRNVFDTYDSLYGTAQELQENIIS